MSDRNNKTERPEEDSESMAETDWRDRLLLESLVGQILPTLIVSDPNKADRVLAVIKADNITLADFLSEFPEYKNTKIENEAAIREKFSGAGSDGDFLPVAGFNHDIFRYLSEELAARKILVIRNDFEYSFQLRLALYNNFNRYINRLLAGLSPAEAEAIYSKLAQISDQREFLSVLGKSIGQPPATIIDGFLSGVKSKKQ